MIVFQSIDLPVSSSGLVVMIHDQKMKDLGSIPIGIIKLLTATRYVPHFARGSNKSPQTTVFQQHYVIERTDRQT